MKTAFASAFRALRFVAGVLVLGMPAPAALAVTATLTIAIPQGGQVVSSPAGINCNAASSPCSAGFVVGSTVTLTATALPGYVFDRWTATGIDSSANPLSAPMPPGTFTVTANFVALHALTVTRAGTGAGTVASAPAGIDCGASCSASFRQGTIVTLTAAPAPGSVFLGWSGSCTGPAAVCQVTMDSAKGATASFGPPYAGALDPSFGNGGIATANSTSGDEYVAGALDGGSTFWVTGSVTSGLSTHLFLAKLDANGIPEMGFGLQGRTLVRSGDSSSGRAIAMQGDGKLVVAGASRVGSALRMLVARFNASGTLDNSFGTAGIFTTTLASEAMALAIAGDGKIVAAGYVHGGAMAIVRLTSGGALDTTFDTDGVKVLGFRGGRDAAFAVKLPLSGQILVAGSASTDATSTVLGIGVARLNADGSVDTTFGPAGQNGLALYRSGDYDVASGMASVGSSIYVTGTARRVGHANYELSLLRLDGNGIVSTAFGTNGWAFVAHPGGDNLAGGPVDVLFGGEVLIASGSHPMLARFTPAGVPDATFGASGVMVDADAPLSGYGSIHPQADGTLLAFASRNSGWPSAVAWDVAMLRYNAAGMRNGSFGVNGVSTSDLFPLSWDVRAMALGPGGKIYFAASMYDLFDRNAAVGRLTPDGQLDSYGGNRFATVALGETDETAHAIVALADGSVVIAGAQGASADADSSFLLAKFDPNGGPDITFGSFGKQIHTAGIGFAQHFALAVQADGRFVAAGRFRLSPGVDAFGVVRYTADGNLDPTFGVSGIAFAQFGSSIDVARAVAIQPDGRIVVAGYTSLPGPVYNVGIARFNANGSLDTTFGSGGKVVLLPQSGSNGIEGLDLALQPDGKILVTAARNNAGDADIAVFRVSAGGTPDATFGAGGMSSVNVGGERPWGMALQANGRIVIVGQTGTGAGDTSMVVVRLTGSGARDSSFGTNGVIQQFIASPNNRATAVKVMADGRIVVAGGAGLDAFHGQWVVARYHGDPLPFLVDTDFNADGRSDILYRNSSTGQVYRFLVDGMSSDNGALAYTEPNTAWTIVGDADFNGDAVTDLLWRNEATGQVYYQPFAANGMPNGGAIFYTEPNPAWKIVHTPDLDGDGRSDILWWNSNTGQVYAMLMNGATIAVESLFYTEPNTAWRIAATGDFSGSGKQNQLLWRNSTTGQVYLMTVTISGNTFSQVGQVIYTEGSLAWKIIGAADFSGDGRTDILWRNDATGQVYMLFMNGTTLIGGGGVYQEPNLAWKVVAHGDYDGDGRADLLWRNDSTGQVYMMLMDGTLITAEGMVYAEPNTAWKILGPWEYGKGVGTLP